MCFGYPIESTIGQYAIETVNLLQFEESTDFGNRDLISAGSHPLEVKLDQLVAP